MLWLTITIIAYFILSVTFLIDKHLLNSGIPNPTLYAFFIGLAGILVVLIIPFVGFVVPGVNQIIIALLAGVFNIYALYWFFQGLQKFDASRIVPAVGGLVPLFSFIFVYIFSWGKEGLSFYGLISFIFLIAGTVLITSEKKSLFSKESLRISIFASLFFALYFVLTKYVYLEQPFWSGLIWTRIGGLLMALIFFVIYSSVRKDIFQKKQNAGLQKSTPIVFVGNQIFGAGAGLLQNWGIALAPLAYVSIINALQGIQYVFLLFITIFVSWKFPQIIREKTTKRIFVQKSIAIFIIILGLCFLTIK